MADSCASCFYGQRHTPWNMRLCSIVSPGWHTGTGPPADASAWPTVHDGDWCGEGVDNATMRPFTQTIPNFTVVAKLPTPTAAIAGMRLFITDAVSTHAVGTALTGGGTITMPVYCSGTAWLAG